MSKLLYVIAVIFLVCWLIGFVVYHVASGLIHLLLAAAVIAIVVGLVKRKS